jgi:Sulfotransferase domain
VTKSSEQRNEIKSRKREQRNEIKSRKREQRNEIKSRKRESRKQKQSSEQRQEIKSRKREIRSRKQKLHEVRKRLRAAENRVEYLQQRGRKKKIQYELFQLERELRTAEEGTAGEPQTGALPDFAVIGVGKGGTTFLYHLLTQHPLIERAAAKELHFFDNYFDLGIEWYRGCFPTPRSDDERTTITGEATPGYLFHPRAPERMAEVVPWARLITLLRNPVDRAYSAYHKDVRHGSKNNRTFEEAIGLVVAAGARETRPLGEGSETAGREDRPGPDEDSEYLSKGVYVDHLLRWSKFFSEEQMLVLKSEDFFGDPVETLKIVLDFLGLPEWEPEPAQLQKKRNTRDYEKMNPKTRRRLEKFFEPHNKRLYAYLGVDFGW